MRDLNHCRNVFDMDKQFSQRRTLTDNKGFDPFGICLTLAARICIFIVDTHGGIAMHVRVQKWGNSLAVRIPKPLAEDAEVREGTVLNLAVSEGKVVATPVERKKQSLKQLLAKITRKNLHAEVDSGASVGREIW